MKNIFLVLLLLMHLNLKAQFVGTPQGLTMPSRPLLDQIGLTPSFAFSTRKLREAYTGFALRIRRNTDNAEADVAFDTNNVVSNTSIVTIAVAGTSGLALNATLTLADFSSGNTLHVSIWYDQGSNGYHGIQTSAANQPIFSMASAGATNQYASLAFTGTSRHHVVVNQTLSTLLTDALRGTLGLLLKPTPATTNNNSFGYFDPSNVNRRWSAHINWPGGGLFTDFGSSVEAAGTRNFVNTSNENKYKQYTLIRYSTTKTTKVSGVVMQNKVTQNVLTALVTGGNFGVGTTTGGLNTENGFFGNMAEFVLFKEDLTNMQINILENNQILFWGAY